MLNRRKCLLIPFLLNALVVSNTPPFKRAWLFRIPLLQTRLFLFVPSP
jgi:hypothetical protein